MSKLLPSFPGSVYSVVAVALERYFHICKPFKNNWVRLKIFVFIVYYIKHIFTFETDGEASRTGLHCRHHHLLLPLQHHEVLRDAHRVHRQGAEGGQHDLQVDSV